MPVSVMDDTSSRREVWKNLPSPTLYPVKEVKFDKYTTPQADGHERALTLPPGGAAIVVDNGEETVRRVSREMHPG
jgi:actin-related protein 5